MLSVIGAGVASQRTSLDFSVIYKRSDMYRSQIEELERQMPLDWLEGVSASKSNAYVRTFWSQIGYLCRRNFVEYWRTHSYAMYRILVVAGLALLISFAFIDKRGVLTSSADVQSWVSSIMIMVSVLGNYNIVTIIPFVFTHKALYYRERASRMYSPYAYAIGNNLVEDPYIVAEVLLSLIVYYFMIGYVTDPLWTFFYFLLISWLFTQAMTFLGLFFAVVMPDAASAQVFGMLTSQVLGLFSGIMVLPSVIPGYLKWIYYISPQRWVQEGLITTQFEFLENPICVPTGSAIVSSDCPDTYVNTTINQQNVCCPRGSLAMTARDFVGSETFLGGPDGYKFEWRFYDLIFLASVVFVARTLGIFFQAKINHNKR